MCGSGKFNFADYCRHYGLSILRSFRPAYYVSCAHSHRSKGFVHANGLGLTTIMKLRVPLWITRSFEGLPLLEKILVGVRLYALISLFAYLLAALVAPLGLSEAYIYRINCDNVDVANGLTQTLRNNVAKSGARVGIGLPVGASLTMSEINLLSEYAENQVAMAPQYVTNLLWTECIGNYNILVSWDPQLHQRIYRRHDDVVKCSRSNSQAFDYRRALERIGLKAILAYAYPTPAFKDSTYVAQVRLRSSRFHIVSNALIAAIIFQILAFVAMVLVYYKKPIKFGRFRSQWAFHIIGLLTLGLFIASTISIAIATELVIEVRSLLRKSLGAFGFLLRMGGVWFAVFWLGEVHALFLGLLWAMPLWCANPEDDDGEDESELVSLASDSRSLALPLMQPKQPKQDFRILVVPMFRHRTFSVYDSQETELRELGQSLSRKTSVRRFNLKRLATQELTVDSEYPLVQSVEYDGYQSHSYPNDLENISEVPELEVYGSQPRVLSVPKMTTPPKFVITTPDNRE